VPYIADDFLSHADDKYYKLKGIAINDPAIGSMVLQRDAIIVPYVDYWSNVLYLNESFMRDIHTGADACGLTDYLNANFRFPPSGKP
jgi:carboxypeptidase D